MRPEAPKKEQARDSFLVGKANRDKTKTEAKALLRADLKDVYDDNPNQALLIAILEELRAR